MREQYHRAMSAVFGAIVATAEFQRDYAVLNLVEDPCLLQGPPGVGKTTLVHATARALFGKEAVALSCYEEAMPEDLLFETEIGQESGNAVNKFRFSVRPRPFMSAPFALLNEANRLSKATLNTFLGIFAEGVLTVQSQELRKSRGKVWIDFNPYYGEFDPAFSDRMVGSLMVEELGVLDQYSLIQRKFGSGYVRDLAATVDHVLPKGSMFAIWDAVNDVTIPEGVAAQATLAMNTLRACKVRLGSISSAYRAQLGCEECRYQAGCLTSELTRPVLARGSEAVLRLARAVAWYAGRDEVSPEDLPVALKLGLAHRCVLDEAVAAKYEHVVAWLVGRLIPSLATKRREWDRGRKTYAAISTALQSGQPAKAGKLIEGYRRSCRDVTCYTMVRDFAEPSLAAAAKPVAAKLEATLSAMLAGSMEYTASDLAKIEREIAWMPEGHQASLQPLLADLQFWMEGEADQSDAAHRALLAELAKISPEAVGQLSAAGGQDVTIEVAGQSLGAIRATRKDAADAVRIRWKAKHSRLADIVRDYAA